MKILEPRQQDIFSFIERKLNIDDVEPMYTAIVAARLPLRTRYQLCFAEGLADHLGLAARMAEQKDFWRAVAEYIDQPYRGGARRHFRGREAREARKTMEHRYPDVADFFRGIPDTYREAELYIRTLPTFGSFSAFKIADMAERTCKVKISFDGVGLPDLAKFPRRGAALAADYIKTDEETLWQRMLDYQWSRLAPPLRDRSLNVQELETCCCNYGHSKWHPPGYEGAELKKLLAGYGRLAEKLSAQIGKDTA